MGSILSTNGPSDDPGTVRTPEPRRAPDGFDKTRRNTLGTSLTLFPCYAFSSLRTFGVRVAESHLSSSVSPQRLTIRFWRSDGASSKPTTAGSPIGARR
jgi:hypothetical protein